jgi:hypothetical protein
LARVVSRRDLDHDWLHRADEVVDERVDKLGHSDGADMRRATLARDLAAHERERGPQFLPDELQRPTGDQASVLSR